MPSSVRAACLAVMVISLSAGCAHSAEVRVLSAAAMQSVFKGIAGEFERSSGHRLVIHYGTIGAINQWLLGGEEADVVIGSSLSLPALVKEGKIAQEDEFQICKTGIGVVVLKGSNVRISSVEDFKNALMAAKAIVCADPKRGGAAGIHVAKVIDRLGLTEQLKSKLRLAAGGDITEVTLSLGAGAIGMTQISEIADKPDAELAGSFPDGLQNETVFVGGIPSSAKEREAAEAFARFLKSPSAVAVIKAKGMQPID